jgi:hypothetical protein
MVKRECRDVVGRCSSIIGKGAEPEEGPGLEARRLCGPNGIQAQPAFASVRSVTPCEIADAVSGEETSSDGIALGPDAGGQGD